MEMTDKRKTERAGWYEYFNQRLPIGLQIWCGKDVEYDVMNMFRCITNQSMQIIEKTDNGKRKLGAKARQEISELAMSIKTRMIAINYDLSIIENARNCMEIISALFYCVNENVKRAEQIAESYK